MSLNNPLPLAALAEHFTEAAVGPCLQAAPSGAGTAVGVHPARVLVLFGADWDGRLLPRYERSGRYRFHEHGFDLFSFPSNAQLMWFNVWKFVDSLVARYRGRIDAVYSSNEQFGALAAALVARRLGLPGADPEVLLCSQHKYEARLRLREFAPDLCPEFDIIAYTITLEEAARLKYPLFVKPVKDYRAIRVTRVVPRILVQGVQARAVETFGTVAEPQDPSSEPPINMQGQVTVSLEKVGGQWQIVEWGSLL